MQWTNTIDLSSWAREFHAYSAFHAVTLAVCALAIFGACLGGRRLSRSGERVWRRTIGWSIVAFQSFAALWRVAPGSFDLNESLPLHMCRVVVWAAALAMLTESRRARTICFFWGLGLSSQGFVTPMWNHGLASVEFWLFWVSHAQIVGVAAYALTVLGYRPVRADLFFASWSGVVFALVVIGANLALGTNYSYLGAGTYENRCVVDLLGPWPWRAPAMIAGALAIFGVLYGLSVGIPLAYNALRRVPGLVRAREVA
ncbi:MAG: TIGR02206 family membrane protein [Phycisphaerales bacterium JB059]